MGRYGTLNEQINKQRVYVTLVNSSPVALTVGTIKRKTKISSPYIKKLLNMLIREGKVRHTKRGDFHYYYV